MLYPDHTSRGLLGKPIISNPFEAMRITGLLPLIFVTLVNAKTFKVFHNTYDPAVFGTTGGAHHNATGDGNVDDLSICIRFQVMSE